MSATLEELELYPCHNDKVKVVLYNGLLFNINNLTKYACEFVGRKGHIGIYGNFPSAVEVIFDDGQAPESVVLAPCCVRVLEKASRKLLGKIKPGDWVTYRMPGAKNKSKGVIITEEPVWICTTRGTKRILDREWLIEKIPTQKEE